VRGPCVLLAANVHGGFHGESLGIKSRVEACSRASPGLMHHGKTPVMGIQCFYP
jgi:hypothetical protein